ncbi:Synaptotagmin-like protein 4 [Fukomys damarensis]|uniref:Synaptotagmin-like protein 4 n=1 Tax=Fukomys damarensis TaxID=885580 RepID=A0A091EDX7_FUKDA|nr:Synaptotagmin-like protein 4 [Fukomys damarensis]
MSEILDLSFLSEMERDLIINVLQRDEELRKADEKRIRRLKSELLEIKRKGAKRGSQHYSDRTCARCQENLGRLTPKTNICRGCNHLVCRDCRIQESNGTWRCKVCTKEIELKKATGDWFYDQKVNRFAYRTGSEIIRMSLRRKPTVPPLLYQVELSVGGQQFNGKGKTRQAGKHAAAAKAWRILQNEPLTKRLEMNGREKEKSLNKSEISEVFEIALNWNLPVNFKVAWESGPLHMKNFVTRISVGEFVGEGEGKIKKISKKNTAIAILEELKKLPPLPTVEQMKPRIK